MKVKVKVRAEIVEYKEIEVELPYYYKHDMCMDVDYDVVIYGKICADVEYTITVSDLPTGVKYELQQDSVSDCYFMEKYASTDAEFIDAMDRAVKFIIGIKSRTE